MYTDWVATAQMQVGNAVDKAQTCMYKVLSASGSLEARLQTQDTKQTYKGLSALAHLTGDDTSMHV